MYVVPPSCNYFDNQMHLHKFSKHPLWGSSRCLENHCTRSYMLSEGPGSGEVERHCRKQNKEDTKTTCEASVGHVGGSLEAPTVMRLRQSSLGTLPWRLCVLSPSVTLRFSYLYPIRNDCLFSVCSLCICQLLVITGSFWAGLIQRLLLKFSTTGLLKE